MKAIVKFLKTCGGQIRCEIHFKADENENITNYLLTNSKGGSEYCCFEEFKNPEDAEKYAERKVEEGREKYVKIKEKRVPQNYVVYL